MKIHAERATVYPRVRLLVGLLALTMFAGCASTEVQADGSTRVKLSVADALGLKKPASAPAAPAPQTLAAAPVHAAIAPAAPAGARLSDKTRSTLVKMLECSEFKNGDDAETVEMSAKGAWTSAPAMLDRPVMVFGLPVSKVELTGDGSAATYIAYFTGVSKEQMIKAASLKLSKSNKKVYYRDAKAGEVSFEHAAPEVALRCYIDTEGSYDDAPAPAKKKKKK